MVLVVFVHDLQAEMTCRYVGGVREVGIMVILGACVIELAERPEARDPR
jgi:hypothetical protein